MSLKELDNWILTEINKLESKQNLRLHRVIYWRFIERNCTLIKRDKPWFAKHLEKMRTIWSYVEFLRANATVASEWKLWLEEQPRKINDKVFNKLVELINKVSSIPFKHLNLLDQIVIDTTPQITQTQTKLDNLVQNAEMKQVDKLVINELEDLVIKEKEKINIINSQIVDATCEIPIININKPKKERKIKEEKVKEEKVKEEKVKEEKKPKEKKTKEHVEIVQVVKGTKSSKYKKICIPINLDTDSD